MRVSISISRGGKFTFSDASTAGQNNNAMCTELRGHSPFQDHPSDINRTLWANVTFLQPVQHIFLGPNLVSESIDRRIGRFFSPLPPPPAFSLCRFETTGEETCQRISLKPAERATKQNSGKLYRMLFSALSLPLLALCLGHCAIHGFDFKLPLMTIL